MPLARARGVLLAVSGGPDSIALMHLATLWRGALGDAAPPWAVATVDHGLRGESAQEAAMVGELAGSLGLPHAVLRWEGPKPARGLQAAAREARDRLLAEEARRSGASHVVTAHHADDQAETILMRLVRGSGPAGLAGMAPQRPLGDLVLFRPLLEIPKEQLLATARSAGLPFVSDPSNDNPAFARTKIRRLARLLGEAGLTPARLAILARRARRAEEALAALAAERFMRHACVNEGAVVLDPEALACPLEIALRLILLAVDRVGKGGDDPVRLARAERLAGDLAAARAKGARLRRTFGGCVVTLGRHGDVTISRERERRRGMFRVHDPQTSAW